MLLALTLFGMLIPFLRSLAMIMFESNRIGTGTISCGFAPSMEVLIAARAVAGMGGGGFVLVFGMHYLGS